jgi:hypothetical protein
MRTALLTSSYRKDAANSALRINAGVDLVRTDKAYDVMKAFLGKYGISGNLTSKDQYFYPIPCNRNKCFRHKITCL